MIAKISTILDTTVENFWKEISKPTSLQFVAAPILYFYPISDTKMEEEWVVEKKYCLKLFLFKIIPLGYHTIILKKIDRTNNEIISNEYGLLTKKWNHSIKFNAINKNQISYTDTIEIEAGILTFFIWSFSHIFYRHRQKRWKQLLTDLTQRGFGG